MVNGFYHLCDTRGYLQQYKIPRTSVQAVPPALLQKTLRDAIIGGLTLQFPAAMFLFSAIGSSMLQQLPSYPTVYLQVRSSSG